MVMLMTGTQNVNALRTVPDDGSPIISSDDYWGIRFKHHVNLPQGEVELAIEYSTTINPAAWEITDNKDIVIDLTILKQPYNVMLWVEHMYALCTIESTSSGFDGIKQDEMTDKPHFYGLGFYIDTSVGYSEVFAIEGYSNFLTSSWSYYVGDYGAGQGEEKKLTEKNLRDAGVYGISFRFVYDINFRGSNQSDHFVSKFIAEDNLILNLDDGSWKDNRGELQDQPETSEHWSAIPGFATIVTIIGLVAFGALVLIKRELNNMNRGR
jgi:hypothetical protein